jgi:hypothetical protein
MIFVLNDDVYADMRLKQRPSILRGGRHAGAHKRNDALNITLLGGDGRDGRSPLSILNHATGNTDRRHRREETHG